MSVTSDLLFAYLRSMFYYNPDADNSLDLGKLEEDYVMVGKGLMFFAQNLTQYHEFARALAKGDLSAEMPPRENELTAPLKSLQANLKHLTYQTQQVAKGDYRQRVDFMGEFADAFNTMVEQLKDRQHRLENEVNISRKHAEAMEQSNLLMSMLTQYISEQIFVYSVENQEILHANELAKHETDSDPDYIKKAISSLPEDNPISGSNSLDIRFTQDDKERFLSINTYRIEWFGVNSVAMVIKDVSDEKRQLIELENYAYRDALTGVYNRFYGLLTLNEWLNEKKLFSLVFIDLDNLKYINDRFGHNEGDIYITKIARHLETYSQDTVVCRLGGDEYMLLVPCADYENTVERMEELQYAIQNDEYLQGKDFYYSISYGIVSVGAKNEWISSEILSKADERMYEHKRARKKERQTTA